MVDRGGLNYPIRVRDEFSKTTELFRKELRASKSAFRDFQNELRSQRGSARTLKQTAEAARALAAAQRDQARATKSKIRPLTQEEQLLRSLAAAQKQQTAREREAVRIRNTQTADARRRAAAVTAAAKAEETALRKQQQAVAALARAERERERIASRIAATQRRDRAAADRTNAEVQAQRRLNRELFQQQITLKQIDLLRARAKTQFAGGDILGGRDSLRRVRELEQGLKGSERAASGLFFTFRRLVGVLALFTLARRAAQAFTDLVRSGIQFNDTIETSTIGIAGLVATLGDVRNSLGESVSQSEELGLALGIAREQIGKLRQDSLRTVATFEELLDTFQIAVGPGLAAGLNLDEIRQLTVDISQAASALGVPQNQLAEEVRSLLSGTIQARTTRIATALGITNADIRRLRETGELFDFLEERFSGFAEAAERQARTTLSGISTLIRGATSELLGKAAQPLFDELLSLGNELFDEVITIRDEAGNIRPNPEAVDAFRTLFEALRDGVRSARDFAQSLGFEGLQNLIGTIGSGLNVALQFSIGFAKSLAATFTVVATVVRSVTSALGLTAERVGVIAGFLGQALGVIVLVRQSSRLLGIEWKAISSAVQKFGPGVARAVGPAAILVAAIGAVAKGVEFVLEKIFGVELGIKDTIELVALGLFGAWIKVVEVVSVLATTITNSLATALDTVITSAKNKASEAKGFIAALFGSEQGAQRAAQERLDRELALTNRNAARRRAAELEIADIRDQAAARQKAIEDEIAAIIGERAGQQAQGEGFDTGFDAEKAAADAQAAADAATTFVSTADKPINELSESLLQVNDELEKARLEFEQAGRSAGIGGFGGQVEGIFNEQEIANAERLRKIRAELANTEEKIVALRERGISADREAEIKAALAAGEAARQEALAADPDSFKAALDAEIAARKEALESLNLTGEEGALVSALRDEKDLRDAINIALETSNDLALTRAATEAAGLIPTLAQENALLQAQVASERAITAAKVNDLDARQQALVAAQTATALARAEADIANEKADAEIRALQARLQAAPDGAEADALQAVLDALVQRRDLEAEILALRIQQLEAAQREAELAANGSLTQGLREGFMQFAEEFSSTFQAGVNIARQSTAALAAFASQAIVDAFDPTKDQSIKERFARFMQQIAQIILQQLIQLAIAKAILGFKDGGVVPELNVAGQTFARGGRVKRKGDKRLPAHAFAQGYAGGGGIGGISPLDTVPAMLRPGEFVMRKEAVDAFGLGMFEAMNGGNMPVVGSGAAEAASPAMGMQTGGLVSDRLEEARTAGASGEGGTSVLPILVAKDREMDQLTAGGRNAMLAFMRENAGNINTLLDRGAGRR